MNMFEKVYEELIRLGADQEYAFEVAVDICIAEERAGFIEDDGLPF